MKLIHIISSLLLEQSIPWYDKVLQSQGSEDLWPIIKLFGGDIHELYNALDKMGKGEDFLSHLTYQWEYDTNALMYVIDALGGMDRWRRGMVDNDLMEKYVIDPYLADIPDLEKTDDGRILLELMPGEESKFFAGDGGRSYDCEYIAKQIFSEEGLEWEPYDEVDSVDNLIKDLSEENYIRLVRHIGIEFQNQEVDAWREEWDEVREDNGKVIITPSFMNGFLPGNESSRYALAVLIGNTPEFDELSTEIQYSYSRAWNDVVINQYYKEYRNAFNELLGKPVGKGSTNTYKDIKDPETGQRRSKLVKVPVKYYDVTDLATRLIVQHARDVDSPDYFVNMYVDESESMAGLPGLLCPQVDDYPDDEEEVNNLFQEILWDYL